MALTPRTQPAPQDDGLQRRLIAGIATAAQSGRPEVTRPPARNPLDVVNDFIDANPLAQEMVSWSASRR